MIKNKIKDILTKEMLEYEYKSLGSMEKIANKLQISIDSIYKYMKIHKIHYEKHYTGIYKCNENFFEQDSEQSYYWAGFIAADGSLQHRKYSKILKICLAKCDFSHLEKFKLSLQSDHVIKNYLVKPSKLVKSENECSEIQITSKLLFDSLNRFNIVPNKTKKYDIPEWLLKHPLMNHFMRGYFDGDGCLSQCGLGKNRIVVQGVFSILGNENFIKKYKSILIEQANLNNVKLNKHYSVYQISYSGNGNIRKIYNFLYKNATIWLDRKYYKFQTIVVPKLPKGALTIS